MIRISTRGPDASAPAWDFRQTAVRIGRRPGNDIVLDDSNVSGHHGEIRTSRKGLVYQDLGSTNGSLLRRERRLLRIGGGARGRMRLQPGDQLLFGAPSAPVVLEAEFVNDAGFASGDDDTDIELARTLDAADAGALRGWSKDFDQSSLLALHQFTERTMAERDLDAMLLTFAECALEMFAAADRVSVYLQGETEDYIPVLSRNRTGACTYEPVSRTLKRVVLDSGHAVLFASSDRALSGASSLRRSDIGVGLCAPLCDGDRTFGFAQVDSRGKLVPFAEQSLQVFAVLARQLALSVSNLQLKEDLSTMVRDLENARAQMERLAYEDSLTGLANRRLFRDRLEQCMRVLERGGGQAAVLYVDLDHFKRINDSLGHDAGDELLRVVAARLSGCVRAPDTVARLGGDEFALLLPEVTGAPGALMVAEKVLRSLREPVQVQSRRLIVTASVGITVAPGDATDAQALLNNADMALYGAKEQGRDNAQFFGDEMKHEASRRLCLESELREALDGGQLRLHYQPMWPLGGRAPSAAEALLRWQHPRRGLLLPSEFITLAEDCGLVVPMGEWVLRESCEQLARMRALAGMPFRLSVNLSPRQMLRGALIDAWDRILSDYSGAARSLQVEITETTLMENLPECRRILDHLRGLGMTVAIDDFGTGYSSLGYLKELPIDTVKIDRRFVQGIGEVPGDADIAGAIIAMAHRLGLSVVGEGIETSGQLSFLHSNGCDLGQGYLLGRPQPFDPGWLRRDGRE